MHQAIYCKNFHAPYQSNFLITGRMLSPICLTVLELVLMYEINIAVLLMGLLLEHKVQELVAQCAGAVFKVVLYKRQFSVG